MAPSQTLEAGETSIPHQQFWENHPFPLVLECRTLHPTWDSVSRWIAEHRQELTNRLSTVGVILFRSFPLTTAEDFDRFIAAFDWPNFPYEESLSNAVRVVKTPRVFTANEAPPDTTIYLHHEMAQTPIHPARLFFFCEQAAEAGGATPVCRSDILWQRLCEQEPEFAQACAQKGLRYTHVMPGENDLKSGMGRSWQSTLGVSSRPAAEDRLRDLRYEWEWLPDQSLQVTTPVLPAVRKLPDGRTTFFNQLIAAFAGWKVGTNQRRPPVMLGDGTPLNENSAHHAVALAEELAFDVVWQTGDVALVDNYLAMHGRRPFRGTRKVLASLVEKAHTI